jgi:hypothetical protein
VYFVQLRIAVSFIVKRFRVYAASMELY